MLGRTDGSWVRPDRREKEGVATQEVMVNWAACSSHLQVEKKKKVLRKVCANGQHCGHTEAVPTQGTKQGREPKEQSGSLHGNVKRQ